MPTAKTQIRLICVFAGRTFHFVVLTCRGNIINKKINYMYIDEAKLTKKHHQISWEMIFDARSVRRNGPIHLQTQFSRTKMYISYIELYNLFKALPRSAVGSAFDKIARGPKHQITSICRICKMGLTGFDTRSGHLLSFSPLLIQEGQCE